MSSASTPRVPSKAEVRNELRLLFKQVLSERDLEVAPAFPAQVERSLPLRTPVAPSGQARPPRDDPPPPSQEWWMGSTSRASLAKDSKKIAYGEVLRQQMRDCEIKKQQQALQERRAEEELEARLARERRELVLANTGKPPLLPVSTYLVYVSDAKDAHLQGEQDEDDESDQSGDQVRLDAPYGRPRWNNESTRATRETDDDDDETGVDTADAALVALKRASVISASSRALLGTHRSQQAMAFKAQGSSGRSSPADLEPNINAYLEMDLDSPSAALTRELIMNEKL